jgi:hypothetical protein
VVVLDVDSTIVLAPSDKDGAATTYQHTYGFHPLLVTYVCLNNRSLVFLEQSEIRLPVRVMWRIVEFMRRQQVHG